MREDRSRVIDALLSGLLHLQNLVLCPRGSTHSDIGQFGEALIIITNTIVIISINISIIDSNSINI